MATLRVKEFDDRLYAALRAKAAKDNRSISQEVTLMIRRFLARPGSDPREATEALLQLAGTWQDKRTAKRIASGLRKSRRSGRRFAEDRDVFD